MKRKLLIILIILALIALGGFLYFKNLLTPDPIPYQAANPIVTKVDTAQTADYNENRNAYFGDLHVHTSWSFDAFIFNVRATPDDAYLFAKGKKINHVSGDSIQLNRPLDFMAVTDHAEYMGIMMQMKDKNSPLSGLEIADRMNDADVKVSEKAFGEIGFSIAINKPIDELIQKKIIANTWRKVVESADRHYEPGTFTTFPAYEWTSSIGKYFARPQYAENQHRNVIFKGGKVSGIPYSSFNSQNPEELWAWMDLQREEGIELLAIPHNANISDGKMYGTTTFKGESMDIDYIQQRTKNEPASEVIQIKGQSMTHPSLSPNDEFANFEVYEHLLGRDDPRRLAIPKGGYVRDAYKDGLVIEQELY